MSQALPSASNRGPRRQYDDWAKAYDSDTAQYGWCAPQTLLKSVTRALPPRPGVKVLDLGIGTGQSSSPYLEAGGKITGLDLAPEMLEEARKRSPSYAGLVQHDLNEPLSGAGVQPGSYDLVISCGTLHFASDLSFTLSEATRSLRPGGILAFTYIPPQDRRFGESTHLHSPRDVERMLKTLGLELVEPQHRFTAYHDKANPADPVQYQRVVARKPLNANDGADRSQALRSQLGFGEHSNFEHGGAAQWRYAGERLV